MRVTTQVVIYVVRRPSAAGGMAARFVNSPLPLRPAHTDNICFFYQRTIVQSHTALRTCIGFRVTSIIQSYQAVLWNSLGKIWQ